MFNNSRRQFIPVVSLAGINSKVDDVDPILFNSLCNPIQESNKINVDVVLLAPNDEVMCNEMRVRLYNTDI